LDSTLSDDDLPKKITGALSDDSSNTLIDNRVGREQVVIGKRAGNLRRHDLV
jgi:hypothetical protein